MSQKKTKNHKQRAKTRNYKYQNPPKKKKKTKYFLYGLLVIAAGFLLFETCIVKRTTVYAAIEITDAKLVINEHTNSYYTFSKFGSHHVSVNVSNVFTINAVSNVDGPIQFEYSSDKWITETFPYSTQIDVKYTRKKVFNKITYVNVKKI